MLLSVERSLRIVLANVPPPRVGTFGLLDAVGCVLAVDVVADRDLPPFHRSAVDGFAVRSRDARPGRTLRVIEVVQAGSVPRKTLQPGTTTRIMTGAPVPEGADAVVMLEKTASLAPSHVVTLGAGARRGQNIARRGEDVRRDQKILSRGTRILPSHVGALAAVGSHRLRVFGRPRISLLATGDELVEVDERPKAGQIRNTNAWSLRSQLGELGFEARYLGIVPDRPGRLEAKLREALRGADLVLVSGAVSAGDVDFVPRILQRLGVRILFRKVAIKPGKPLVFGRRGRTLVFGLPGNPVSGFVIFEVYLRPVLGRMMGHVGFERPRLPARLGRTWPSSRDREQYVPCRFAWRKDLLWAEPVVWHGSGDLVGLSRSSGFAIIPQKSAPMPKGSALEVIAWE